MLVVVVRYETTATAGWALLFIVRAFFNDTITVAVWTGFHVYASWDATTPPRLYSLVPCGSDGCETVYGKVWWRTAPAVLSLLALQILLLVPNWPRFWRRQRRSTGRRRVRLPFVGTDACLIASVGASATGTPQICIQRAVDKAARRHGYLSMSALPPKADMCSALAHF